MSRFKTTIETERGAYLSRTGRDFLRQDFEALGLRFTLIAEHRDAARCNILDKNFPETTWANFSITRQRYGDHFHDWSETLLTIDREGHIFLSDRAAEIIAAHNARVDELQALSCTATTTPNN